MKNKIIRNREYKKITLEPITAQLIEEVERDEGYKQNEKFDVMYFSVYKDLFNDFDFQEKIELYGAHYFLFWQYLKAEMLDSGKYYIYEKHIDRLIKQYCLKFFANIEEIKAIYKDLVSCKYISVVECSCFESAVIVDPIIFNNYRLVQEKRVQNRERKRRERTKKQEVPSEPLTAIKNVVDDTNFNNEFGSDNFVNDEQEAFWP